MTEQTRKQTNLSNYYIKKGDIKNNLTSTDTDKPLSANQGKELKELIDNIDVQEAIDLTDYIQKSNTNGLIKNDGTIDTNTYVKTSDIEDNLTSTNTDKPLSAKQGRELKTLIDNLDLNSGSGETVDLTDYIQKSSTEGLLKNDGTVDTNTYLTQHQSLDNYIQKSNTTGLVKNNGTIDTNNYATEEELFSKNYEDLLNTPEIPTKVSDLTNDSGFLTEHQSLDNYIEKSNTTGLVKNDGTIDTNTYLTQHQSLDNYIQKSNTTGLIKNDGTIDTNTYLTQHQSLDSKNITVEKQITAEEGYLSTYSIKQGNTQVGQINIPKDYLVKSASIETCSVDDTPTGFEEGDKYIDFVINVKEGSANNEHIYLAVNDLVDAYTAGTGLVLTNNNEFKHSNSITAQNTNEFKKFKFDSEGHITGTADVEGSDLPNHKHTKFITEFTFEDILNNSQGIGEGRCFLATAENENINIEPNTLYFVSTTSNGTLHSTYVTYMTYENDNGDLGAELLNDWSINWTQVFNKPSTFTPSSHTHGNVTNDGKIGNTSGKILTTGTNGTIQASDSITKSKISDFPSLANVATSGSYNDLTNKPTLSSLSTSTGELQFSDINGLANLLAVYLSQEDQTVNLSGGGSGTPQIIFDRIGKIVFFRIYASYEGTAANWGGTGAPYYLNNVGTLPENFKPKRTYVLHLQNYGTNDVEIMVEITTNGQINLKTKDKTKNVLFNGNGSYICQFDPFNSTE